MTEINAAETALVKAREAWYATLPEFPADGVCTECGETQYVAIEVGYHRWTHGEWVPSEDEDDAGYLHLTTDGWDDMAETGEFEWMECDQYNGDGCGKEYQVPDNREWD